MYLKNILAIVALSSIFAFTSCKSEPNTTNTTESATPATPPADAATMPAQTAQPEQPASEPVLQTGTGQNSQQMQLSTPSGNTQPIQVQSTQAAPPASTTPNPNSGKINPAHGQPGHTCSVPVGSVIP